MYIVYMYTIMYILIRGYTHLSLIHYYRSLIANKEHSVCFSCEVTLVTKVP